MKMTILSELSPYCAGSIVGFIENSDCDIKAIRERLADLGFTEGAEIVRLFAAPCGDPRAYLIRNAVISLRNRDAACISVGVEG